MFQNPAHRPVVSIFLVLLGIGFGAATAQAAPLTYSTAQTISLSSPATTFTIATSSAADALQVNATSVVVTLSSSTSGSFTLTSVSYNLTIASSSGGGTVTLSCTSGIASTTISQATGQTNYTISPAASQCTTASNNSGSGSGGGGSVGVGSQYGSPYIPGVGIIASSTQTTATSTIMTSSTAELQAEITSLVTLLNSLIAQANERGMVPSGTGTGAPHVFKTNLHIGMSNSDITYLQTFLAENKAIYPEKKITGYFGVRTLRAVQRFQKKYSLAKSGESLYGYVGPATRAKLDALIQKGLVP
jgi:peptidoglycan hydrolase-like protein with peptidoglycan-binding domain